jgi:predicted enzyme related to lactoylglutathione lyase
VTTDPYRPGRTEGAPCWAEAALPDIEAGKRFYGDLFGWTFDEGAGAERGYYTAAYRADDAVAALRPGVAGWWVHLAVRDAYDAAERVTAAGGRIAAEPVPGGTQATVALAAGPEGAVFGLWQAGSHRGFDRTGVPGTFHHAELHTPDPGRSGPFYGQVFGYAAGGAEVDVRASEAAEGADAGAGRDRDPGSAALPTRAAPGGRLPKGVADSQRGSAPALARVVFGVGRPARLLPYFTCPDTTPGAVAALCAEAVRLGGRVERGPYPSAYGTLAVLADDQGAVLGVCEPPHRGSQGV